MYGEVQYVKKGEVMHFTGMAREKVSLVLKGKVVVMEPTNSIALRNCL
jgi:hypothetical protein